MKQWPYALEKMTGIDLLSLPVEIRLHVYSYLHRPKLHLDFCKVSAESRLTASNASSRPSPLLSYLNKRKATSQWARNHGLHLLVTNSILRQEYMGLLERSETSLVPHCADCLAGLLQHVVRDLGIRKPIFKSIWMKVDFFSCNYDYSPYDVWLEHIIAHFRRLVRTFYGHFELLGTDDVPGDMGRRWLVERLNIIGQLPSTKVTHGPGGEELSIMDSDDENDEEDEQGERRILRGYCGRPGVKELERRSKRWNVTNISDPDSRQRQDLASAMRRAQPSPDYDHWRISRSLRQDYEAAGKCAKRLVVREETWVGVHMGS